MRRHDVTDWLPIDRAAHAADVSRRTIHRWIRSGKVRSRRIGGRTEVCAIDLPRPDVGGRVSLLDLFAPLRDAGFASILGRVHRERGRQIPRRVPRLG